jgi:hypothetical protein
MQRQRGASLRGDTPPANYSYAVFRKKREGKLRQQPVA